MHVIDFILEPYRTASTIDIILEIVAALFGVASVYFAKKNRIEVYPTGIISTGIYIYICYKALLYGDTIINLYYTAMSLYGWFMWSRTRQGRQLQITRMNSYDMLRASIIFVFTAVFVLAIYMYTERMGFVVSYLDIFTTAVFFCAMYLMANRKLEHWIFWIMGNIISVPLYLYKGLALTSVQYFIFLILAIQGYAEWKKIIRLR